ncbi:MAG TPA: DUF3999 family protein [Vicinamibacteria bacterium]|nr:DUF3999 family protein [Vicinamibacteria bacterium]
MRSGLLALALALAAADQPTVERPIAVDGPGRVAVALDRDVYAGARVDLGDLRVVDDAGQRVPFVIDRDAPEPLQPLRPAVLNRAFVPGSSVLATLDFGEKVRKSALRLSLPGDNFRRRVEVQGSDDGRDFTTLVDDAWVFAIPGAARYERVALPQGDHRYLRVVVHRGPDDPRRLDVGEVTAEGGRVEAPPAGSTVPVAMRQVQRERERDTLLILDLPGPRHPFQAVEIDVSTPSFVRSVVVEAQRVPLDWVAIGHGVLYRYESGGRLYEQTRLDVTGRERRIRLRIRNLDDAPLDVRAARITVPRERVLFEARPGRAYFLSYGDATASAPSFDLQRTMGSPRAWATGAQEGKLRQPQRISGAQAETRPWTERHPALLWAGLVVVALLLGAVTWRALREA